MRNLRLSNRRLPPRSSGQAARALGFPPQTGCRDCVLTNSVNLPSAISSPRGLDSAHQFIHKEGSRWPVPTAPQCGQISEEWSQLRFKTLCLALQTPTIWPRPPPLPAQGFPLGRQAGPLLCQNHSPTFSSASFLHHSPLSSLSLIH